MPRNQPQTCWEKYDEWCWDSGDGVVDRRSKVLNFIRPNPKVNYIILVIFRIMAFIITFSGSGWDIVKWIKGGFP